MKTTIDQYGVNLVVEIEKVDNGIIVRNGKSSKFFADVEAYLETLADSFRDKIAKDLSYRKIDKCKYSISINRIANDDSN